ncbi:type II secretion system protein N [Caenimonas koreensis]|nr:type II secretion system protein N [Caenimonas koreensis]
MQGRWVVAASTFLVWAIVAATCVYWGLKIASRSPPLAAPALVHTPAPVDPVSVARLMGWNPVQAVAVAAPSIASRFSLQGVVATGEQGGAALISVDGKPAKPFRTGSAIDGNLVLKSVESRKAVLSDGANGPAVVTLELPLRRP